MPPHILDEPYKAAKQAVLDQFEATYLEHLLGRHGYNITRIAADAGVDRHLIRKLLRKHGMLRR